MPVVVLLVEDSPGDVRLTQEAFRDANPSIHLHVAADGVEAMAFLKHQGLHTQAPRPDLILLDLNLPKMDGREVLAHIKDDADLKTIPTIILTTSDSDGEIQRALRAGAAAYILKSMPKNELLGVIRSVHAGKRHVPPDVAARLAEHMADDDLTTRELEVLRLIRDGYRNKQIADQLAIAETTVNFHIKNLVDKLGANDRTHAVTIAVRRGLLQI